MKILFICIGCFLSFAVLAQPKPAKVGVTYGSKINAKGALEVALVEEKLATSESFTGKIKGTVTSVCEKKGCWMKLAQTDGEGIMIRFKDYKFFMPKDLVGKDVVLQGEAKKTITDVATQRHYAEDAGKSAAEIEKIKEPKIEIEFIATGVLVVG